jgi:hypothetical protein
MALSYGTGSNLNGCVLYLDASNTKSYPGAGNTWYDLSGNGLNAILTNGPTFNNSYGGCIQNDGVNDYISVAHNSVLNFGTGDFTILMWVSGIAGYPGCVPALLWKGANFSNNNAGYTMAWACNSPALYFITADGSSKINFTDSPIYSLNGWTGVKMIGMRRSGGNLYQINNGITTLLGASALNVNNSSTMYFAYDATYNGYLSCKIHAVQMFNRGVSDSELTNVFAATRNRYFGTLPFAPSDISGLQLWLDADDPRTLYSDTSGTTKATTDGTAVALWVDKSGNGRNASQSTAASRPAVKSAFTNGRNVLNFDGSNDTLTVPSSTSTFKFLHSTASTVFIVVQYKATGTYRSYFTTASSSNHVGYIIFSNTDNTSYIPWIAGGVGGSLVVSNQSAANYIDASQAYLVCAASDPTNATAANRAISYKNGTAPYKNNVSTLTPSTANSTYDLAIGSEGNTYFANVYIAEIVVYNALLTASQRIQVETYLNNKWGLWSIFTPSSISGLTLWLDASDPASLFQNTNATTPAYQTSDYVSLWKDKSGNGNNATQATDSLRPYLVTSSQNSRNVIRFPYAAWNAATGPYMNATIGSLSAYSVFIICKFRTSEYYSMVLTGGSSQFEVRNYSTTGYIEWNIAGGYFPRDTVSNVGSYILIELTRSGSDYTLYKNGISVGTSNNASSLNIGSTIYISSRSGNGYYFDGDMAEMIIYNSALSTAQRQQVEQYLNKKWGVF